MEDLRVSRRRVLKAAAVTGVVGAVIGPTAAFAKHQQPLGPFSDWSEPVNLGPVVNSSSNTFHPGISKDELSLYFTSDRPGGVNAANLIPVTELWVTQRQRLDAPWEQPLNLGPQINSFGYSSGVPNLTPNGHWLFFGSSRPGGCNAPSPNGNTDLWVARREDPEDEEDLAWEAPLNLGCKINTPSAQDSPVYFKDRETGITNLYFTRFDGPGGTFENPDQNYNIYVSTLGEDGSFGPGVLVRELNSAFRNTRMAIRSDGLEMIFTSNRPGGIGPARLNLNLWVATRASTRDRWSTPVNLGPRINRGFNDRGPALSFDGNTLNFASRRPGGFGKSDLWGPRAPSWSRGEHTGFVASYERRTRDAEPPSADRLTNGRVVVLTSNQPVRNRYAPRPAGPGDRGAGSRGRARPCRGAPSRGMPGGQSAWRGRMSPRKSSTSSWE